MRRQEAHLQGFAAPPVVWTLSHTSIHVPPPPASGSQRNPCLVGSRAWFSFLLTPGDPPQLPHEAGAGLLPASKGSRLTMQGSFLPVPQLRARSQATGATMLKEPSLPSKATWPDRPEKMLSALASGGGTGDRTTARSHPITGLPRRGLP